MKMVVRCIAFLGLVAILSAPRASAQLLLPFDELGNGFFGPGVLQPDPTGGVVGAPVLIYPLPFAGTPGDVLMHDAAVAGNPFLDVIRFTGAGQLIFYSDNTDGADAPADTPAPPNPLFPNQVNIQEVGVEGGLESALYIPLPGQPGFDPTLPPGAQYFFISDLPEPGSLTLVLAAFGLCARRTRRWLGA